MTFEKDFWMLLKENNIFLPTPFDGGEGEGEGEGEGDGDGDGGGDDVTVLKSQLENMQSEFRKLKSNRDEILGELKNVKSTWKDLDPDKVKNLMQKFEQDEDMQLIAEGKHDAVIEKRTAKIKEQYEGLANEASKKAQTYEEQNKVLQSQVSDMKIDMDVVSAFIQNGGKDTAIDDVKMRAKPIWRYEEGKLVAYDSDGDKIPGKKGDYTPDEFIEDLKEKAPHLFGESTSSNSTGNKNSRGRLNIDIQIENARKSGDIETLRALKKAKREGKTSA